MRGQAAVLVCRASCIIGLVVGVVLGLATASGATPITIGPTSNGNLLIRPGDLVAGGYLVAIAGQHPADQIGVTSARVSLPVSCSDAGPVAGVITVSLEDGLFGVPADTAAGNPSVDPGAAASFQGVTPAPDLCGGGIMHSSASSPPGGGAIFSADVRASDPHPVAVSFHFRIPAAAGSANVICMSPSAGRPACSSLWNLPVIAAPSALPPPAAVPEAPFALGFPCVGAVVVGLIVVGKRRRRAREPRLAAGG